MGKYYATLANFFRWTKSVKIRNHSQRESGFTLIELLMVTIIVGILSSLAILTVVAQVQKAQEVEAVNSIGSMNRLQQEEYHARNNFGKSLTELGFSIPKTANAIASPLDVFNIDSQQTENFIYGTYSFKFDGQLLAINFAIAKKGNIKSVVGAVLGGDNGVNTCGPVKINANMHSSLPEVFSLMIDMRLNPSKYCFGLF